MSSLTTFFMKQLLITIAFFGFIVSLPAQNTIDSLQQVLTQHTQQDSTRLATLLELANLTRKVDVEGAEKQFNEALELSRLLRLKERETYTLTRITQFYVQRGLLDKALSYGILAKKLADSLNDKMRILDANAELLTVYGNNKNFGEAKALADENYRLTQDDPPSSEKARNLMNLASVARAIGDYSKAEQYYKEGIGIAQTIDFVPGEKVLMLSLATLYKDTKQFDKAEPLLQDAIAYYESTEQEARLAGPYYSMATLNSLQGKHIEAVPWYQKSLAIYEKQGSLYWIKRINQNLYINYSIQGKTEAADAVNEIYLATRDSIESKERKEIIEDMRIKYETEKIEAEKELAEAKSERNKNLLIGAIIISGLILMAAFLYFSRMRAQKKAEMITLELKETQKRLALEKQYRDSELKALKAQMNPHFIFNALNSIQEYIILNKKDLAGDYLGMFADLMRRYLQQSDSGVISLQEEVETLRMYLELESLRFEDSFSHEITVEASINSEQIKIPTMLVQPYIENAIKHGLLHKKENRNLQVGFSQQDEKNLICTIEDNGIGREKAIAIKSQSGKLYQGFATKATESRLNLLNFGKDRKIGVTITDLFNEAREAIGTRVVLSIPIQKA